MKVKVNKSTLVRPASGTPNGVLWTSNIDHWTPLGYVNILMFYRDSNKLFDAAALRAALSRALLLFYPMAGRLKIGGGGRNEIDCNGEGVMFLEAEFDGDLDDIGDFATSSEIRQLIPAVDYSREISTLPLTYLQVTRFKCGAISIGAATSHKVVDGGSGIHLIIAWAALARGLDVKNPPHIDRMLLRARDPPQPRFEHIEYRPPPRLMKFLPQNENASLDVTISLLKVTRHQLDVLKAKSKENGNNTTYSSFVTLAAHIWRCACKSRGLPKDQQTNLYISIDGRSRFNPPLPPSFFGNAIFPIGPSVVYGDMETNPVSYGMSKIHNAIVRMDDEYLRSAIDYLELQPDLKACVFGDHYFKSPNFSITSWLSMPVYDADFGWGRPIFVGPGGAMPEGKAHVMRSSLIDDGSLLIAIALPREENMIFRNFFYDI